MSVWDTYEAHITARGGTKRGASKQREERLIWNHLVDNLSYTQAVVDGYERNVGIMNSDNLEEKTIIAMPGEDLRHGALVEWMDNKWLITERDANTTIYTKCKMIQCNYYLQWVNENNQIVGQYVRVEDGTKFKTEFRCTVMCRNNHPLNCWEGARKDYIATA